jgi:hypothetical protein
MATQPELHSMDSSAKMNTDLDSCPLQSQHNRPDNSSRFVTTRDNTTNNLGGYRNSTLTSAWNGLGLVNIISSSPDIRRKPSLSTEYTWWDAMVDILLLLLDSCWEVAVKNLLSESGGILLLTQISLLWKGCYALFPFLCSNFFASCRRARFFLLSWSL